MKINALDDLEKVKKEKLSEMQPSSENAKRVVVGMATCGIAAGARPVLEAIQEEVRARHLKQVDVELTGCIGICKYEPIVEVIDANQDKVTYVQMDADKARRVVVEHIVNGTICHDLTMKQIDKK